MSYIQTPRLHFSGLFQADPSTVNNDPHHFDTNTFESNYNLPGSGANNGWWNPGGTASWRFFECSVQRVVYRDGTACDDPNVDPVVGAPVSTGDGRTAGKIVDLDPEQQMVSEIWGLRIVLGGGSGVGFSISGDFEVAAFGDIWVRYAQGQPNTFFGAFYQSVLKSLDWRSETASRFLKELDELLPGDKAERKLSIKFNVDGFQDNSSLPMFTFGRVVGSIGLHSPEEPVHFLAARALTPTPGATPVMGNAYAVIDGFSLFVDLGNSLPTISAGGPISTSAGQLYVAALQANGPKLLGEIDYNSENWYQKTSGIVELKLNPDQLNAAQGSPLAIAQSSILLQPAVLATPPLLAEAPNGAFLRADSFVFRLNPGESASTKFYATQFGLRYAKQQISLGYDPSVMQGQILQGPLSGPKRSGHPSPLCSSTRPSRPEGTARFNSG